MKEILAFFSDCWLQILIAVAVSYLISSVNTSIIVTRIVMRKDIRTMGSGNAGFTNVLRCVGKVPAAVTFIGDFLKGVISVGLALCLMIGFEGDKAELYRAYLAYMAGLFAVVGHSFPIYYKFKGGKGVVTTFAVMLMTDWRVLLCVLIIFAIFFLMTRIISLCAIINFALYGFLTLGWRLLDYYGTTGAVAPLKYPTMSFVAYATVVSFIIGLLIIIRHKDNIKRLLNGTEKKIKAKQ